MGTPTRAEQVVPAELNLAQLSEKTVLVYVKTPKNANDDAKKVSFALNRAVITALVLRGGVLTENVVPFSKLTTFRKNNVASDLMKPPLLGQKLGSDVILYITVEKAKVPQLQGTEFYEGQLSLKAELFDVATGDYLWPTDGLAKRINVGFGYDNKGYEDAIRRLAASGSHCVTRYLHDCPLPAFRIVDETYGSQF